MFRGLEDWNALGDQGADELDRRTCAQPYVADRLKVPKR